MFDYERSRFLIGKMSQKGGAGLELPQKKQMRLNI